MPRFCVPGTPPGGLQTCDSYKDRALLASLACCWVALAATRANCMAQRRLRDVNIRENRRQKTLHRTCSTIKRSEDTMEHTSGAATRAICMARGRIPRPKPQACSLCRFDYLDRRCLVPLKDIQGWVGGSSVRCRRSHRISASVRPFPP